MMLEIILQFTGLPGAQFFGARACVVVPGLVGAFLNSNYNGGERHRRRFGKLLVVGHRYAGKEAAR